MKVYFPLPITGSFIDKIILRDSSFITRVCDEKILLVHLTNLEQKCP